MSEVGKPKTKITIKPDVEPVPQKQPLSEPVPVEAEPERVPA